MTLVVSACSNPREEWEIAIGAAPGKNIASPTVGDTLYLQAVETHRGVNGESAVTSSLESPSYFVWTSSPPQHADFLSPGVLHLKEGGWVYVAVKTSNAEHRIAMAIGVRPRVRICPVSGC